MMQAYILKRPFFMYVKSQRRAESLGQTFGMQTAVLRDASMHDDDDGDVILPNLVQ